MTDAPGPLQQAQALRVAGRYAEALPLAEAALAARAGGAPLGLAEALSEVAFLAGELGQGPRACALYEQALARYEEALGPEHPVVATALVNLGEARRAAGRPEAAIPPLRRALGLRVRRLGRRDPKVATALHNLAAAWADLRDLRRAALLYRRALALREAALGPDHPQVATTLNVLGELGLRRRDLAAARPLLERALRIRRERLGPAHPAVGRSLNNLAVLAEHEGRPADAVPLLEEALGVYRAAVGEEHALVASALANLAEARRALRDLEGALGPARQSLRLREAAGTPGPLAASLNNVAALHELRGEPAEARALYERALAILEGEGAAAARDHGDGGPPLLATVACNLGALHLVTGELGPALTPLRRAVLASERRVRRERVGLSPEHLAGLLGQMSYQERCVLTLAWRRPEDEEARRLALATLALRKGRAVDELAARRRALAATPAGQRALGRLRALRVRNAGLRLSAASAADLGAREAEIRAAEREVAELEERLSAAGAADRDASPGAERLSVAGAADPGAAPGAPWLDALPEQPDALLAALAAALPPRGVLLELRRFRPIGDEGLAPRYLALLLLGEGGTALCDLGEAAPIDGAVQRLRAALADPAQDPLPAAQAAHRAVLAPLLPKIRGADHLLVVPDGALLFAPLAALHDGTTYLDEPLVSYLTSGRDLLRPAPRLAPGGALLLADPDLSRLPPGLGRFPPLPGARLEAAALGALLPGARVLCGADASDLRLLSPPAPGLLHVATHGICRPGPPEAAEGPARGGPVADRADDPARGFVLRPPPPPDDPLLRSALLLAAGEGTDGVLTALELGEADLRGTALVVLSACETGLGDLAEAGGVFGLRRAVMLAGAEALVCSLWRVSDQATTDLMVDLYRRLLAGEARAAALRDAMRAVRAARPHPFYWAPFIHLGAPGPLPRGRGLA